MQHLRANLPSYEVGLYEQNVLTFLFYTKPELLDMVIFDISSYGLNCWCALVTLCRWTCWQASNLIHPAVCNLVLTCCTGGWCYTYELLLMCEMIL